MTRKYGQDERRLPDRKKYKKKEWEDVYKRQIQFLMGYVRRHDFKFFGYYRIILGIVVLAYFGITALAS